MRPVSLMLLWLLSVALAGPGEMGPKPGVLDTVGAQDTGLLRENPFGVTPPEHCSSHILRNGIQLPERKELYSLWNPNKSWATAEMAHVITVGAEEMAWQMPHADPLIIGDISRHGGGHLSGHKSHRAGVDADIGIFTRGGKQPQGGYFVNVTPSTIDYEANWLFWRSLLETGLVERVLLDQSLIDAMRRYLVRTGELTAAEAAAIFPPRGTPRLWARTGVFQHAVNHQNHIHLRVRCGVSPAEPGDVSVLDPQR